MVSRCTKRIKEKIAESEMWVEGEFCSEQDMKGELSFSECLACAHTHLGTKDQDQSRQGRVRQAPGMDQDSVPVMWESSICPCQERSL